MKRLLLFILALLVIPYSYAATPTPYPEPTIVQTASSVFSGYAPTPIILTGGYPIASTSLVFSYWMTFGTDLPDMVCYGSLPDQLYTDGLRFSGRNTLNGSWDEVDGKSATLTTNAYPGFISPAFFAFGFMDQAPLPNGLTAGNYSIQMWIAPDLTVTPQALGPAIQIQVLPSPTPAIYQFLAQYVAGTPVPLMSPVPITTPLLVPQGTPVVIVRSIKNVFNGLGSESRLNLFADASAPHLGEGLLFGNIRLVVTAGAGYWADSASCANSYRSITFSVSSQDVYTEVWLYEYESDPSTFLTPGLVNYKLSYICPVVAGTPVYTQIAQNLQVWVGPTSTPIPVPPVLTAVATWYVGSSHYTSAPIETPIVGDYVDSPYWKFTTAGSPSTPFKLIFHIDETLRLAMAARPTPITNPFYSIYTGGVFPVAHNSKSVTFTVSAGMYPYHYLGIRLAPFSTVSYPAGSYSNTLILENIAGTPVETYILQMEVAQWSPTVTPTLDETLTTTYTATITKTIPITRTFTPTYTKTSTITLTPTVTYTSTPYQVWHHNTKDSDHGVVTINNSSGTAVINLSDMDPYFIDGLWNGKATRDSILSNSYISISKTGGVLTIQVLNLYDSSPLDCTYFPQVILWNVWRLP